MNEIILQQSEHWEEAVEARDFVEKGFPFKEGFPDNCIGAKYTLIVRNLTIYPNATVDLTRRHLAEGIRWRSEEGELIFPTIVVAWQEQLPESA